MTVCEGYCALNLANSSARQLSANEQPAFISGNNTFFIGFKILAVSAIKWTPQKTIISQSTLSDCSANARLSPI